MANLTPSTKRIAHDALKSRLHTLKKTKPMDTVAVLKRNGGWDCLPAPVKKIIENSTRNRFSSYKKKIASLEKAIKEIKNAGEVPMPVEKQVREYVGNWLTFDQLQVGKTYIVGGVGTKEAWIGAEVKVIYVKTDNGIEKRPEVVTSSPEDFPYVGSHFVKENLVLYKEFFTKSS